MKVVEHTSEADDHDFGSPTVNRALRDVIKARNMLGRHQRVSEQNQINLLQSDFAP